MSKINDKPQSDINSIDFPNLADFSKQSGLDSESKKFVVFYLNGELFAVSADVVKEIVQPLAITSLPASPAWIAGIANLRGEIIAVLSLPHICRQIPQRSFPKTKMIIFRPPSFDLPVAFSIDRIAEIASFLPENIIPVEENFLSGKIVLNSNKVSLLDADKIFSSLSGNS